MKILNPITAVAACIVLLTACSATSHHHAAAEAKPTIRLTLIPQASSIQVKLNTIETRSLITKNDLAQPLQLFAIDPTLTNFILITPQDSTIPGLYNFTFTPKLPGGYRVWADVRPNATISKTQAEEFPHADMGAHKAGSINKTESHDAIVEGYHFALSFDHPLTSDDESIGSIRVTDKENKTVNASGEIIGFYDDFHSVFRTPLDKQLTFQLAPAKPGFIKLFAQVQLNGKTLSVPFGVMATKAP